jgi:sodium/potassium-transporting ATPase subunit alpha
LKTFLRSYGIIGPAEAALSFVVFFVILAGGEWVWGERLSVTNTLYRQAAAGFLATIIFCQIGNVMACRTNRQSAARHVFKYNSWITAGVFVELAFIFGIIYLPVAVIYQFFTTAPLPLGIWPVIVLTPFVIFGIEEIRKFLVRRGVNILSA